MENKQLIGNPGRSRLASTQDWEFRHFAERHGITIDQARDLIRQHGRRSPREALDAAAERLKTH